MAVQTPQEGLFAVEIETIFLKFDGAETKFHFLGVADISTTVQQFAF